MSKCQTFKINKKCYCVLRKHCKNLKKFRKFYWLFESLFKKYLDVLEKINKIFKKLTKIWISRCYRGSLLAEARAVPHSLQIFRVWRVTFPLFPLATPLQTCIIYSLMLIIEYLVLYIVLIVPTYIHKQQSHHLYRYRLVQTRGVNRAGPNAGRA